MKPTRASSTENNHATLLERLQRNDQTALSLIRRLHPAEIADLIESLTPEQRKPVWKAIDPALKGHVLLEVHDEVRAELVAATDHSELTRALTTIDADDLADVFADLPAQVNEALISAMDVQRRQRFDAVRSYPDDTAGGLMDADAVAVRADVPLGVVLRYLRRLRRRAGRLPELLDAVMVVSRNNDYLGSLPLSELVSAETSAFVHQVMDPNVEGIEAGTSASRVARLFQDRDLLSAAVVDNRNKLIGRITVDDILDVIREEADHTVMRRAGLSEETDMFAPVLRGATRRALWLGVNLVNALIAAWVIGLFDAAIEQMVALAVLMPVVASMGGVAGSQTLTLVTRGIALEHITASNARQLLTKELGIACINGVLWAVIVAAVAGLWFRDVGLALVFALALVTNLLNGALVGTVLPLFLTRLGIDPALAGGVMLIAATDVIGFASFLGLASLLLLGA